LNTVFAEIGCNLRKKRSETAKYVWILKLFAVFIKNLKLSIDYFQKCVKLTLALDVLER